MVNPTGYTALDLVGFTDKGPYAPNVNYVRNDLSHDSGNIWRCLIDDTIGIRPTEGANWTIFISEPSNMVETSIAPIETSPATAAHTVGTQLYYNDTLYKVKAAIAVGDSLVVDTNIELADNITTQLAAKANTSDLGTAAAKDSTSTIAQGSTDLIESGSVYSALGDKANTADLGTAAAKDSTNAVTQSSTDLVESGAVYSELSSVKQALSDEVTTRATLGAHNLIPNTYADEVIGGELSVHVEDDGSLTVSTIGTTTAARQYFIIWHYYFPQGTYILSGAPDEGQGQDYCLYFSHNQNYYDTGKGVTAIVNTSGYSSIVLSVAAGQNFSNKKFYPMLRLATDTDTTYQPYAMTNQQLTDKAAELEVKPSRVTENIDDLNNVLSDFNTLFYYTDTNTLNTPYKQGITTAGNQFIINVYGNGNYNTQLAIDIGRNGMFIRRRSAGTWSQWETFAFSS